MICLLICPFTSFHIESSQVLYNYSNLTIVTVVSVGGWPHSRELPPYKGSISYWRAGIIVCTTSFVNFWSVHRHVYYKNYDTFQLFFALDMIVLVLSCIIEHFPFLAFHFVPFFLCNVNEIHELFYGNFHEIFLQNPIH